MLFVPEKVFGLCRDDITGVDGAIGDSGSNGGVRLWLTGSSGISSTVVWTRRFLVKPLMALLIEFCFGCRLWVCFLLSVSLSSSDPEVAGGIFLGDLYLYTEDVLEVAGVKLDGLANC